jgi:excisionase family DNA binding protein
MSTVTGQAVALVGAGAGVLEEGLGDGRQYMTAEDLAERWDVTLAWVYAETRARRIPHLRLGRYVRYRRSTIEAWEREKEEGALVSAAGSGHDGGARETVGGRV